MNFLKKTTENAQGPEGRNAVTEKIKEAVNKVRGGWANWMARHTAPFNKKDWMVSLAVLVFVMGGYSTYLLIGGFTGSPVGSFSVSRIHQPGAAKQKGQQNALQVAVSLSEYKRIVRFHRYMDSLKADSRGRVTYDSIVQKRPLLMDSIRQIEKYYQQLKQK